MLSSRTSQETCFNKYVRISASYSYCNDVTPLSGELIVIQTQAYSRDQTSEPWWGGGGEANASSSVNACFKNVFVYF